MPEHQTIEYKELWHANTEAESNGFEKRGN